MGRITKVVLFLSVLAEFINSEGLRFMTAVFVSLPFCVRGLLLFVSPELNGAPSWNSLDFRSTRIHTACFVLGFSKALHQTEHRTAREGSTSNKSPVRFAVT